jgi:transcriptional regulator of arginine metabolism
MPATRAQRHQRIASLIAEGPVRTQDELQRRLEALGIVTTQATLSRDLREMGVAKSPAGYVLPGEGGAAEAPGEALARAVRRELVSAEPAGTMVVLRTGPGHANALAVAIDRTRPGEVVGTIAGDDTVFCAVRTAGDARQVADRMRSLAGLQ